VFQDANPIAQRHRMRQLEEQQNLFRFVGSTPIQVECDSKVSALY